VPYYIHDRERELSEARERGEYAVYLTASMAHAAKATRRLYSGIDDAGEPIAIPADRLTVTFEPTSDERYYWRERESGRLRDREYVPLPWKHDPAWLSALGELDGDDQRRYHFPHISVKQAGKMAYTQNEEHGFCDRQTAVRPGKYLTQYFSEYLDKATIDRFCGLVSSNGHQVIYTNDPDAIEQVYIAEGFGSCMRHTAESFNGICHPVRAYGGPYSSLALAYVGDLSRKYIVARTIVWPDKKLWNRIFGHYDLLAPLLEADGYSQGSMRGATIAALTDDDRTYTVPYVDNVSRGSLSRNKRSIILGSGPIALDTTDGLSAAYEEEEEEDPLYTCSRCDYQSDRSSHFEGDLCTACDESMYTCDECDRRFHSDDESLTESGDRYLCDRCYSRSSTECDRDGCAETWIESDRFSDEETAARTVRHAIGLCPDCDEELDGCPNCSDYTPRGSTVCDECGESTGRLCPETIALPLDETAGETAGERDDRS
jgi:hypothetical protein